MSIINEFTRSKEGTTVRYVSAGVHAYMHIGEGLDGMTVINLLVLFPIIYNTMGI